MGVKRRGARRLPNLSIPTNPAPSAPGNIETPSTQEARPAGYTAVWLELKELFRRVWQLEVLQGASPLTTKGDIWGFDTKDNRIPVGTDTYILIADSSQALGVKWGPNTGTLASPLTTKGDIWGFSTTDARIPIGTNGNVLTADSTQTLGLKWAPVAGTGTVTSITATSPVVVTPSPITGTGDISHATSGVTATTYGDSTHVPQVAVNATGHITSASNVAIAFPAAGALQSQPFTASGTFNVPAGVTGVWLTMIGAGGGGATTISAASGGGGGGSAEVVNSLAIPCTASGTISVTIGAKGTGGAASQSSAQAGVDGGDTSVTANSLTYYARGGKGGTITNTGGAGGGTRGGAGGTANIVGVLGTQESPVYFGGAGGGGGANSTANNGGPGAPNAGFPTGASGGTAASTQGGGGGGGTSPWGVGGAGGNGGAAGNNAASTSYGAGGGGSGGHATTTVGGGDGCDGYVLIVWVA